MSTITPITNPTPTAIPNDFPRASVGSSFAQAQHARDVQMKKQLELSIEDSRKTTARLEHMLNEVNERLGLNKPDGPEDAA